jgi:hypothetical protein
MEEIIIMRRRSRRRLGICFQLQRSSLLVYLPRKIASDKCSYAQSIR